MSQKNTNDIMKDIKQSLVDLAMVGYSLSEIGKYNIHHEYEMPERIKRIIFCGNFLCDLIRSAKSIKIEGFPHLTNNLTTDVVDKICKENIRHFIENINILSRNILYKDGMKIVCEEQKDEMIIFACRYVLQLTWIFQLQLNGPVNKDEDSFEETYGTNTESYSIH